MPETGNHMIVYHPHGLHKRVTSCWAKKMKAVRLQSLGESLRFLALSWNIAPRFPSILARFASYRFPQKI